MELEEIKSSIKTSIYNIETIIKTDNLSAHHKILASLFKSIDYLELEDVTEAKKQIAFSIRLLMEAPPSNNRELSRETLMSMDRVYKSL